MSAFPAGRARRPFGTWTDAAGTAHIREAGSGLTFCGNKVDPDARAHPVTACEACVAESIADHARHHDCGADCRAPLDRRVPQASLDRRLSWSGELLPSPQPCQDIDLLRRVHERLRRL